MSRSTPVRGFLNLSDFLSSRYTFSSRWVSLIYQIYHATNRHHILAQLTNDSNSYFNTVFTYLLFIFFMKFMKFMIDDGWLHLHTDGATLDEILLFRRCSIWANWTRMISNENIKMITDDDIDPVGQNIELSNPK